MGQAKKKAQQVCPVKKTQIPPHECARKRMSEYCCPESCPLNPWTAGNYDKVLEIQDATALKRVDRFTAEELAKYGHVREVDRLSAEDPIETTLFLIRRFFVERDAQGRTFADRWKTEGWSGLTTDQRMHEIFESGMYPALLEVRQILNDREVLAVDLLGKPEGLLRIVDRGLASTVCRFSVVLSFVYKTAFYFRTHGAGIPVEEINQLGPEEVLDTVVRHLGGPSRSHGEKLRAWLVDHFERVVAGIVETQKARRQLLLHGTDANRVDTEYALQCPAKEIEGEIRTWKEVCPDDVEAKEKARGMTHKWIWARPSQMIEGGLEVSGQIELYRDGHLNHCVFCSAGNRRLRPLLEKRLGPRIQFRAERVQELGRQIAARESLNYDAALVPPELLENPGEVEVSLTRLPAGAAGSGTRRIEDVAAARIDRHFLDESVPMLEGKTPREAARSRRLRPLLVQLMKARVRHSDEQNLRQGTQREINPLLKELGLEELCFPPPPVRTPPREERMPAVEAYEEAYEGEVEPLDFETIKEREEILQQLPRELLLDFMRQNFPEVEAWTREFMEPHLPSALYTELLHIAARLIALAWNPLMELSEGSPLDLEQAMLEMMERDEEGEAVNALFDRMLEKMLVIHGLSVLKESFPEEKISPHFSRIVMFLIMLTDEIHLLRD